MGQASIGCMHKVRRAAAEVTRGEGEAGPEATGEYSHEGDARRGGMA